MGILDLLSCGLASVLLTKALAVATEIGRVGCWRCGSCFREFVSGVVS